MQTRLLGASDTATGAVGLGCMGMDWAYAPDDGSDSPAAVVRKALECGATLLDTADMYGPFTNEETVGKAIAGIRDQVVLATKGGNIVRDSTTFRLAQDGSPGYLRRACEASLQRLGVEHIDLYYLHRPDPAVPIEDSVGALASLAREGKIKMIGLSEVDLPTLRRAHAEHPVTALQSELSLWTPESLLRSSPGATPTACPSSRSRRSAGGFSLVPCALPASCGKATFVDSCRASATGRSRRTWRS